MSMHTKTIKPINHQSIVNTIIKAIDDRSECLNDNDNRAIKDRFLEQFTMCEMVARKAIFIHKKSNNKRVNEKSIKLQISAIKQALKNTGYIYESDMIDDLFKTREKRGEKTAKDLRNGIVHSLNVNDIREVVERKEELFSLMDSFIELMKS